jgi:catechol 2,3-dioxygenase-like lactoylglutathione lyase family enzyme
MIKRTTLWVRNLERSLAFYRDIIGLAVLEQKELAGPAIAGLVGFEDGRMRIAHLGLPGSTHGWVGLYEISGTRPPAQELAPPPRERIALGQTVIVFETADIDTVRRRLLEAKCRLLKEPGQYVRPARDGVPGARLIEIIVFDPDDVLVSIMGSKPLD